MLRSVVTAVTGAALGVGLSIGYKVQPPTALPMRLIRLKSLLMQIRNLKRDINDVDPVDEASFGAMGAAAALFARNPAFITKQAFPCIFLPPLPPPPHHNCNNPVFPLQFPALYVSILNQYPMPVKSITTGITCAPPPARSFLPPCFQA
jgi:hypothetical protein